MNPFKDTVALRESPDAADQLDGKRLEQLLRNPWSRYDDLLRNYHRQVEENVRMVAGQQDSIFHPGLGRWLEVNEWMSQEDLRWRKRPQMNRLLGWYMVTHARATENPPIVTFNPGPDRHDAELAAVMDVAFKTLWREIGMTDVNDRMMGWVIVAGRAHLMSRIDRNRGPLVPWVGSAQLPMMDETGSPIIDPNTGQPAVTDDTENDIPFDSSGNPLAHVTHDGLVQITGDPHVEREGVLRVDVLSPLNVRGTWGPTPWHEKPEHIIKTYHTPEEVWELTGQECEPDVRGGAASDLGELERILYGTGFYGAIDNRIGSHTTGTSTEGFCELTQRWQAPSPIAGMEETESSPGGRFTMGTRSKILIDSVRPAAFPYTSPLATFEFVRLPGRPNGTTPQEALNPVQRHYNDGYARIGEHVALSTNPKAIIDQMSGIKPGEFTNAPGDNFVVAKRPGVTAVEYAVPPQLGDDVYKFQDMMRQELIEIGQLKNSSSELPQDASGELIKELRFDDDRFLGPTLRRAVEEYGRFIEGWRVVLPLIWDQEKVISYSGDDNMAHTIVVMPEMFKKGRVNVSPDVESMLPEGRGERQRRVDWMYQQGLLGGPPGTPVAIQRYYDVANFPHLSRTLKPGGVDRTTAEQENGALVQGADPRNIPIFPWYDDDVHLMVLESFMKSPEFLKQSPEIQNGFVFHWQAHTKSKQLKMQAALVQQAQQNAMLNPQPPSGGGAGGGAPGDGPPQGGDVNPGPPKPPSDEPPGGRMPTVQTAPGLP